jgi:hypothetical protein
VLASTSKGIERKIVIFGIGVSTDPAPLVSADLTSHMIATIGFLYFGLTHGTEGYVDIPLRPFLVFPF